MTDEAAIEQVGDDTSIGIYEEHPYFGEEWVCNCSSVEEGKEDLKRIKSDSRKRGSDKIYKLIWTARKSWK